MGFPVHTVGHANDGGGVVTDVPQDFVRINGQLVSVDGSRGTGHPPCPAIPIHCKDNWVTANGASFLRINGIPVNHEGNKDTCDHVRAGGSDFVFVNLS